MGRFGASRRTKPLGSLHCRYRETARRIRTASAVRGTATTTTPHWRRSGGRAYVRRHLRLRRPRYDAVFLDAFENDGGVAFKQAVERRFDELRAQNKMPGIQRGRGGSMQQGAGGGTVWSKMRSMRGGG